MCNKHWLLLCLRMMIGAFAVIMTIETAIIISFLEVDVSRGVGGGKGCFSVQRK